jgi:hypothetical protein
MMRHAQSVAIIYSIRTDASTNHKLTVMSLHQKIEFLVRVRRIQGYIIEETDIDRPTVIRFPELSLKTAYAEHEQRNLLCKLSLTRSF